MEALQKQVDDNQEHRAETEEMKPKRAYKKEADKTAEEEAGRNRMH